MRRRVSKLPKEKKKWCSESIRISYDITQQIQNHMNLMNLDSHLYSFFCIPFKGEVDPCPLIPPLTSATVCIFSRGQKEHIVTWPLHQRGSSSLRPELLKQGLVSWASPQCGILPEPTAIYIFYLFIWNIKNEDRSSVSAACVLTGNLYGSLWALDCMLWRQ